MHRMFIDIFVLSASVPSFIIVLATKNNSFVYVKVTFVRPLHLSTPIFKLVLYKMPNLLDIVLDVASVDKNSFT